MKCRVCDSADLELAIDLGSHPWCNNFLTKRQLGKEPFYPLRVVFCHSCRTAQLDYTVKKEIMFGDHTYLSGMTKTLDDHFRKLAGEVDSRFFKSAGAKSVLDIGSNDGTQLKHYKALSYDIVGVESSKAIAKMANERGIKTLNEFFNLESARRMGRKFSVINASGVFFHLEELHSVTEGIREALSEDGVFVVQFLYMKRIIENLAFDQIYHEHLLYYTLETIEKLLARHGLSMFDAYLSPIHGGSIIGFVTHAGKREKSERLLKLLEEERKEKSNEFSTYKKFAEDIQLLKQRNLAYLSGAKKAGKKIYGMGAPVKGNTFLNYFGIGPETIECLVEKNPMRKGLYSPGMHIPVVLESELKQQPDIYYVLAWNFKKEILANNGHLVEKGVEFYFPVDPKEV
ncbi:TPA: class I SAM-dependent methyltransferase [Candidatus Micrarchaeota archaeon]|nr:class I SAM-dependent methyltransferase [Candidatus Micrarchaeota archaeon]